MPKHILIVNDAEDLRHLMRDILQGEGGYEVTEGTYRPGMSIHEWVEGLKPDLVIADVMFDQEPLGFELVDTLRLNPATAHIPIILCSGAITALRERQAYLAERRVGVLYKPFAVDDLLRTVKQMLDEWEV
ncbi:MAG: response regulator [Chloroflexota bacterium]|nr:response regulator [Chloroflexota bacterium]